MREYDTSTGYRSAVNGRIILFASEEQYCEAIASKE